MFSPPRIKCPTRLVYVDWPSPLPAPSFALGVVGTSRAGVSPDGAESSAAAAVPGALLGAGAPSGASAVAGLGPDVSPSAASAVTGPGTGAPAVSADSAVTGAGLGGADACAASAAAGLGPDAAASAVAGLGPDVASAAASAATGVGLGAAAPSSASRRDRYASITYTRALAELFNTVTSERSGAWIMAIALACSSAREGSVASNRTASASSASPSITAPLISSLR